MTELRCNRVMFVDDEQNVLKSLKWLFADEPYDFHVFTSPVEALDMLHKYRFAVVVADQRMQEMSGTDFLERVRRYHPDTVRIIATAYASMEVTVNAINRGHVYRFLFKPWDERELKQTIRTAVAHHELLLENRRLIALLQVQNEELRAVNRRLEKTVQIRTEKIKENEVERRALESKLIHAQKLEAIGTFAGGIAHDFNNILSAIMGYTELAKLSVADNDRIVNYLNQLEKAEMRAKELVQQILSFSRQSNAGSTPLKLNEIVYETLKMLRSILPSTIVIRHDVADCGLVMGSETQIHQVVMNLCSNAYHAMEENGGILTVALSKTIIEETDVGRAGALKPGSYSKLVVKDTGPGINGDLTQKIFEPYFTTKSKEKGTGLGLSVARGIIQNLGGAIRVTNQKDGGAAFSVYLPLVQGEAIEALPEVGSTPGGDERILFVDDEPSLADIGRQMLDHLGYDVVALTDSRAALELFRANPHRFDLVITDMTMPKMTGDRLAEQILEIHPDIPVIICTGFSEKLSADKAAEMRIGALAMKPLVRRELAVTVRALLDGCKTDTAGVSAAP